MGVKLYDYQKEALSRMKNGSILCGTVGSGKSRTGLAYYYIQNGGQLDPLTRLENPKDLYIITTARKRDTLEWEGELCPFLLYSEGQNAPRVTIDSWNNIKKYADVIGAFFIFDEQRVVGKGEWVKSFLKIAKSNDWILLSATPGDTWQDYIPVFIANGFYRNRTQFNNEHIIWKPFSRYPQVSRYVDTGRLIKYRNDILVMMDFERSTVPHNIYIDCLYDTLAYKRIQKERWDIWKNEPLTNASELCYALRKVTNSSPDRQAQFLDILEDHKKVIVFYNFDYELDILKSLPYQMGTEVAEWNGHKHESIPHSDKWVYLVQYTAGAEGWNCIETDTIIFWSRSYSYKTTIQASGRINRLNTPFTDLYYYYLVSKAPIDIAIGRALKNKKQFNERKFVEKW